MSGAQYLYRRDSGVYFVRFCVPARLKAAVGKGEIHRSTGCRDFRLAKIVAAEMAAHWHKAIEAVKGMDPAKIKAVSVELLGNGYIPLTDAASTLGTTPAHLAQRLLDCQSSFYVTAKNWFGWSGNPLPAFFDQERDEFGQKSVVTSPNRVGGPEALVPYTGVLQVLHAEEAVQVAAGELDTICVFLIPPFRDHGFVVDVPGRKVTVGDIQVKRADVARLRERLASQMAAGPHNEPKVATTHSGMRFSELAREYLKRESGKWKVDQQERREFHCAVFQEFTGDPYLAEITRPMLRKFEDAIAKLPSNRDRVKKRFKFPEATFCELVELAETNNLPRFTIDSQRRLLEGIAEVFAWAVKETYMTSNPATGLGNEVQAKAAAGARGRAFEEREAFSDSDLMTIFAFEWWRNGVGRKTPQGRFFSYKPHYYWLPLLALFTGGRLNELSQLYIKDILQIEGVWCIDFNLDGAGKLDEDGTGSDEDKSLKTINSERSVPIHRFLLELGFVSYVTELGKQGYERVFPELKYDGRKGYGRAAGKWFNDRFLGTAVGIKRDGRKVFHSFRHNFATVLGRNNVSNVIRADLMGHARADALSESRYDKGRRIHELKAVVDSVSYELPPVASFNVQAGIQAVHDALQLKERRRHSRSSS